MAQKRTNAEVVARALLSAPPADKSLQSCDGPREWFLDSTLSLWNDLSTACVYQYTSNIKGACRRMLSSVAKAKGRERGQSRLLQRTSAVFRLCHSARRRRRV